MGRFHQRLPRPQAQASFRFRRRRGHRHLRADAHPGLSGQGRAHPAPGHHLAGSTVERYCGWHQPGRRCQSPGFPGDAQLRHDHLHGAAGQMGQGSSAGGVEPGGAHPGGQGFHQIQAHRLRRHRLRRGQRHAAVRRGQAGLVRSDVRLLRHSPRPVSPGAALGRDHRGGHAGGRGAHGHQGGHTSEQRQLGQLGLGPGRGHDPPWPGHPDHRHGGRGHRLLGQTPA